MTGRSLKGAVVAACFLFAGSAVGQQGPRTRAERTNYLETSHYSDVMAFLDSLRGRPELFFGSIGKTNEGREIPYVIASRPRVTTPHEARKLNRPIVYVQGNIHAGEVEGKEALLALLRDLTGSKRRNVLDSIILIAVPDYNADGNEKFASQERNRGSQNGPEMVGVRANAQGFDLNRDYIKAEAPETRASLAMFNKWDPEVFVDLHTTDGSYHGYALTYAAPLNPAAPLGVWARDSMLTVLRQRMQSRHGYAAFDYGDFFSQDTLSKGWYTFDARPRFGTNYYGLRGRVAILSEAYSHDPFEKRVAATYAFVKEILSLAAEKRAQLPRTRFPHSYPLRTEMIPAPDSQNVVAEVMERVGSDIRTQAGVPKGLKRTGKFVTVKMPVYDRFKATLWTDMPVRYFIPARDTAVVRLLRLHGVNVAMGPLSLARKRMRLQQFSIDSVVTAPRAFQGHKETRLEGRWRDYSGPLPGSYYVVDVTLLPRGPLSVYLLEPQSEDGLVDWNYLDNELRPSGTYPILRALPPLHN
ncbi:MAG TPA: M14 family metallopeptidase [Gemmatimonadaceae bacterium]|nr:M14 family metallopeptidase [Gemmatimonadaceae bacterium]